MYTLGLFVTFNKLLTRSVVNEVKLNLIYIIKIKVNII
jgi:hypothetical protein